VDFSSLIGKTTEQVAEILGTSKKDELLRLKQHYYMRIAPGMVSPSPCVRELISQLEAKGYKIAVVTSSSRSTAEFSLSIIGLRPHVLVTGDSVLRPKPDPYPVEVALRQLDAEAGLSIGVGDSKPDLKAFTGAGIKRVFILRGKVDEVEVKKLGGFPVDSLCEVIQRLS